MDQSTYRNVVLGLIFLKYVSDTFEERHAELEATEYPEDAEDRDFYDAENIFWLPENARWSVIAAAAKTPDVGTIIDAAMTSIENENDSIKGVLPKNYASDDLSKERLGEVIDLFTDVQVGDEESRKNDVLGRVYEFFLRKFATNGDGEFYTPRSIVRTLVDMIQPFSGKIYDPFCGSGGMFVQSEEFVSEHQGNILDLSVYGQEWNPTTWRLAKMNLAIHGIDNNLGPRNANTLLDDQHRGERFDYALANPPLTLRIGARIRLLTIHVGSGACRETAMPTMRGLNIFLASSHLMVKLVLFSPTVHCPRQVKMNMLYARLYLRIIRWMRLWQCHLRCFIRFRFLSLFGFLI